MALAANSASASQFVSPNTLYYLALYFLVIVVRFFKLKRDSNEVPFKIRSVLHVALELVYTASGLVVLLLADLRDYIPFIIISYLILVLVSSQIESLESRFSPAATSGTHLVILLIIVAVTVSYFEFIQPGVQRNRAQELAQAQQERLPRHVTYRVAIPYNDPTLIELLGARFGARQMVAIYDISDTSGIDDARALALRKFNDDFKPWKLKSPESTRPSIDEPRVVVQAIAR